MSTECYASYQIIDSALMNDNPDLELEKLQKSGFINKELPEVAAMVNFGGGDTGHKDLWMHTKQVVRQTLPQSHLRWAALFHDVGKVKRISRHSGKISFHGHEPLSANMFFRAAKRIGIEQEKRDRITFLIGNLGWIEGYESNWTESAIRRLSKHIGDNLEDLLALSRADITTKHQDRKRALLKRIHELGEKIKQVRIDDAKVPPLPSGIGNAIMESFNLPPSKKIGDIRKLLEQAVESGELPRCWAPEFYIEFLKNNTERFGLCT